ncbi:hypothetical protein [Gallibacterium sp. AGMB14963]|uniref:hypothetical protein n=1 Tax=Gallibacterium faecale TaxID=3019086 RepID=UPI0022F15A5D|nr:hypothetical protein [Gallibacterium sp. AGMB14963]MDA3977940.1 hypothetical protein [Gallibacterium sp. AGMB14963]
MNKRWVIGGSVVILSGLAIAGYQLSQLSNTITQQLATEYAIELPPQNIKISYFPFSLHLKNIVYQQDTWHISARELNLKLSYLGWLSGNQWIKQIRLIDGQLTNQQQLYLDQVNAIIDYQDSGKGQQVQILKAENQQITDLQGQFQLHRTPSQIDLQQLALQWQWRKPIAQMTAMKVAADKISWQQSPQSQINAENLQINQAMFPAIKALIHNEHTDLQIFTPNQGELALSKQNTNEQQTVWTISGRKIAAEQLSQLLGYQPLVVADFDLQGQVTQAGGELADAEVAFMSVGGGQIKGFNLLGLVGNSLPFAISGLEQSLQDTTFEHMEGHLVGNHKQWRLQQGEIVLHDLRLIGEGSIHPVTSQCEWQFAIQPTKERFEEYHLNLDLEGDCFSPTYRIRLDDAIKNKLKSKLQELLDKI